MSLSLGPNSKITARLSDRNRIREFYRDILGCKVVEEQNIDLVWLGRNFHIGFLYEDEVLQESDLLKGLWLELRVDRPAVLKKKILNYGVREIPYRDKKHFYFQAPGGQVFRLAGKNEDA